MKKVLDSFLNYESAGLDEYIGARLFENLEERTDYKKLKKEKTEIYQKYKWIEELFEDHTLRGYDDKEIESISEVFRINGAMEVLEEKEIFKLGAKESIAFLKEQNMLSI